jgi:hypothetical protein
MSDETKRPERKLPELPKCRRCDKIAMLHVTDADPDTGKMKTLHLCERHAAEFLSGGNPDRPADPRP